jgi:hypothetical protein
MKTSAAAIILALLLISLESTAQGRIYRSSGGEIIFSGADVNYLGEHGSKNVNTNTRFTLFFHVQQLVNFDLTNKFGFYTGVAIRNVGLITEDLYQYLGFTGIDESNMYWNRTTKIKRRSYSLGFPLALKLGNLNRDYFLYAGGEYEWMFHYKQKMFLDDNKSKYNEWTSDRVNPWIPSLFAGIQFPGGFNLKLKYYMKDFLNPDFQGMDFGQEVDYSQFESSGIWYISVALVLNKKQLKKMLEGPQFSKTAYRY